MNYIDAYVEKVIGKPKFRFNKWWVPVTYNYEGGVASTALSFNTKEQAEIVKKGYRFLY